MMVIVDFFFEGRRSRWSPSIWNSSQLNSWADNSHFGIEFSQGAQINPLHWTIDLKALVWVLMI